MTATDFAKWEAEMVHDHDDQIWWAWWLGAALVCAAIWWALVCAVVQVLT